MELKILDFSLAFNFTPSGLNFLLLSKAMTVINLPCAFWEMTLHVWI